MEAEKYFDLIPKINVISRCGYINSMRCFIHTTYVHICIQKYTNHTVIDIAKPAKWSTTDIINIYEYIVYFKTEFCTLFYEYEYIQLFNPSIRVWSTCTRILSISAHNCGNVWKAFHPSEAFSRLHNFAIRCIFNVIFLLCCMALTKCEESEQRISITIVIIVTVTPIFGI